MTDNIQWTRFYTPKKVANEILKYLPKQFKPDIVVDICAGSGNFLESSYNKKWKGVKYSAFDVNESGLPRLNAPWSFTKLDSLEIGKLLAHVPLKKRKLVLANPPFGACYRRIACINKCKHLENLFLEANKTNRMEAKMLLSNLSLMKQGDVFAAVLPENIFSSDMFANFKEEFLRHFTILKIGEPKKYFRTCEVRTRIFVGIYTTDKTRVRVNRHTQKSTQSKIQIFRGIDNTKLSDTKINNQKFKEVLHFNNSTGHQPKSKYIKFDKSLDGKIIRAHDLLIIRVGRHAGKVFKATPNFIGKLYSDYFFLVKNVTRSKSECDNIETRLKTNIKGLTTNYLNKRDIENALTIY